MLEFEPRSIQLQFSVLSILAMKKQGLHINKIFGCKFSLEQLQVCSFSVPQYFHLENGDN